MNLKIKHNYKMAFGISATIHIAALFIVSYVVIDSSEIKLDEKKVPTINIRLQEPKKTKPKEIPPPKEPTKIFSKQELSQSQEAFLPKQMAFNNTIQAIKPSSMTSGLSNSIPNKPDVTPISTTSLIYKQVNSKSLEISTLKAFQNTQTVNPKSESEPTKNYSKTFTKQATLTSGENSLIKESQNIQPIKLASVSQQDTGARESTKIIEVPTSQNSTQDLKTSPVQIQNESFSLASLKNNEVSQSFSSKNYHSNTIKPIPFAKNENRRMASNPSSKSKFMGKIESNAPNYSVKLISGSKNRNMQIAKLSDDHGIKLNTRKIDPRIMSSATLNHQRETAPSTFKDFTDHNKLNLGVSAKALHIDKSQSSYIIPHNEAIIIVGTRKNIPLKNNIQPKTFHENHKLPVTKPVKSADFSMHESTLTSNSLPLIASVPRKFIKSNPVSNSTNDRLDLLRFNFDREVREKINQLKTYPKYAKRRGFEGEPVISFTIDKNGRLSKYSLASSSGYQVLDNSALELIKKAVPYPKIPDKLKMESIKIKLPISYNIK